MSYKCRIYNKTGFNSIDLPYNLATIEAGVDSSHPAYSVKALDIRQNKFLNPIRVSATENQVKLCDYCVVYTGDSIASPGDFWCYYVEGYTMLATDVAELYTVPDFTTSGGGIPNVHIISGITRRSTRAALEIDANELPTDPYLAPARPMEVVSDWLDAATGNKANLIQSTIALWLMGQDTFSSGYKVTVSSDPGRPVVVPIPAQVTSTTEIKYRMSSTNIIKMHGYSVYLADKEVIQKGLSKARGLGIENAVTNSWVVDRGYVTIKESTPGGDNGIVESITGVKNFLTSNQVSLKISDNLNFSSTIDTPIHSKIKSIINYSSFASIYMLTASGDSIACDPKDIFSYPNDKVLVDYTTDPRPDGKPYYRFRFLNTNTAEDGGKWWRNVICGLPWKQVPIVFTEVSGNALNTLRFEASRNVANVGLIASENSIANSIDVARQSAQMAQAGAKLGYDESNMYNSLGVAQNIAANSVGIATDVLNMVNNGRAGSTAGTIEAGVNAIGGIGNIVGSAISAGINGYWLTKNYEYAIASNTLGYDLLRQTEGVNVENILSIYDAQRNSDVLSYGISNTVTVPTVMFPYNTETLRDFVGNGILLIRYKYDNSDLERIARIIKAFGVAYTKETSRNDYEPATDMNYCYVDANIQVGSQPRWMCNAIANQLSGGVRIWKTRPYRIEI